MLRKIRKMIKRCITLISGYCFLRKISRKYANSSKTVIVLTDLGIGDVCIACSLMPSFLKNKEYVIYCRDKYIGIAKEFGVDNIIGVKGKMYKKCTAAFNNDVLRYFILRKKTDNVFYVYPFAFMTVNACLFKEISVHKVIEKVIFRLETHTKPITPIVKNSNVMGIVDTNRKYVVINPYSNSQAVNFCIFDQIISFFNEKGMNVYCNLAPNQKALKNSIPLNCSIEELYSVLLGAECVVSVRSGILDYEINALNNLFVINANIKATGFHPLISTKYFYSMTSWEKELNLVEIDERDYSLEQLTTWYNETVAKQ